MAESIWRMQMLKSHNFRNIVLKGIRGHQFHIRIQNLKIQNGGINMADEL